jgi:hypothetical protein
LDHILDRILTARRWPAQAILWTPSDDEFRSV